MTALARLLAAALALLCALPASAAPALWQVSDGDSRIWLFGSFHVLPPALEWRTPAFDKVLAGADKVYFEADVGDAAQASIVTRTFEIGMNALGTTLSSQLQPADADMLRSTIAEMQLPMGMLQAMKPWLATTTISSAALIAAGYDPTRGVDMLLQKQLPKERQAFFESAEEQLGFLASAPEDEQISMLTDTLKQLHALSGMTDDMVAAWSDGVPEQLGAIFMQDSAGYDGFVQRLIYDRNNTWSNKIEAMLAANEQNFIVVGAGHLIGDGSVVDLLERQGHRVKRLQ
ncbi:TraB/GumN family protein [uncultured Devosia sp.]|uniref:TraB/GumN family protein n=1 Tax=uncultured Devosia sp. TaxID=211434 RepID=UPI0035CC980F